MKMNTKKALSRLCIAIGFTMTMTCAAWAGENTPTTDTAVQTEAAVSQVITAGAGETIAAEETEAGPASADAPAEETAAKTVSKGESLGMFTTTGYCNCSQCSNGHGLTYSGTVPKAAHTISADLTQYPIGTRLMIDDVIYTVEDMGSSVKGNWIDIYYDTHEGAVAHGMKTQEVFRVVEE